MSLTFSSSQVYRPIVILPIALGLLLSAAAILWTNLAHETDARRANAKSPLAASPAMASILVSRSDISRGQLLSADDFAVKSVAPSQLPLGALSHASDADSHLALKSIRAGAPLTKDALSDQAILGLSARVPQSYRAYAIAVSESNIAGGFVQAGDRVDLYVTLPGALFQDGQTEGRSDRSKAALLLQSVQVLAVGAKLKGDAAPQPFVRTVTLAVSASDLARLALAARLGAVSLAIRNPADDGTASASQAELASLVAPAAAPIRSGVTGRTRRGVPLYAGHNQMLLPEP